MRSSLNTLLATSSLWTLGRTQSSTTQCSTTISASYAAPSLAEGYVARIVASNLTSPRGIKFDSQGALLVVQEGVGISVHNIVDAGNDCLSVSNSKVIVEDDSLNHGIELSEDGNTLYASNAESLYSWDYSAQNQATTSDSRTLVNGMNGTDHSSRTLLLSRQVPGMMVINRGSFENIDERALNISTGVSQIKAFNLSNITDTPYDYPTEGLRLGWGLRNDVGIAEHPSTGGIWSVENSADQLERSGDDIHEDNPAEKLNFLGYLNGTASEEQGRNFGYPECFSAWDPEALPDFDGTVGEQFAIGDLSATNNDSLCADRQTPRLSFQAHMAPLDIVFNTAGSAAWISFHGSWNRDDPVGYKLSVVEFADGEPTENSSSTVAAKDIMSNQDLSACPSGCFRPVGLAWDQQGRLFMSSDSTGEIYVITRNDGNATNVVGTNVTIPGSTGSGTQSASPSQSSSAAGTRSWPSILGALFSAFALLL
ncbi:L-sorbosone dehydrogenase [Pseudocercospora fuligena]|uniref:L-sorbosone dehydrogenase n=1 Tax=Pseudocercospora fuligena TaxID=685502 RepID=A0A8H6RT43_9PEZI|nr:L-sorbosone dehydrogenase [Pseudocercospora fuligena]